MDREDRKKKFTNKYNDEERYVKVYIQNVTDIEEITYEDVYDGAHNIDKETVDNKTLKDFLKIMKNKTGYMFSDGNSYQENLIDPIFMHEFIIGTTESDGRTLTVKSYENLEKYKTYLLTFIFRTQEEYSNLNVNMNINIRLGLKTLNVWECWEDYNKYF